MKKSYLAIVCLLLFLISIIPLFRHFQFPVFSNKRKNITIVIDVGHGGSDPGKVNTSGIREKDINLQIAHYLKDYLIAQDYIVFLTRETDCGLYDANAANKKTSDLNNRLKFFKEKQADYVISIHQNSYPDEKPHGAQTFYYTNSNAGKELASNIQNSLLKIDSTNTRKEKSSDSYYLLKHSSVPSVIVECGFLSNPNETARLSDANYQKQLAYSICLGICQYDSSIKK